MNSLGWILIQYGWYPHKKRKWWVYTEIHRGKTTWRQMVKKAIDEQKGQNSEETSSNDTLNPDLQPPKSWENMSIAQAIPCAVVCYGRPSKLIWALLFQLNSVPCKLKLWEWNQSLHFGIYVPEVSYLSRSVLRCCSAVAQQSLSWPRGTGPFPCVHARDQEACGVSLLSDLFPQCAGVTYFCSIFRLHSTGSLHLWLRELLSLNSLLPPLMEDRHWLTQSRVPVGLLSVLPLPSGLSGLHEKSRLSLASPQHNPRSAEGPA